MEKKIKELTLRLLIVDDSGEHAEALVTNLRNGGIAVRPSRPQSLKEIDTLLTGSNPIDLVLASVSEAIPINAIRERIAARGRDIPLIMVTDKLDENELIKSINEGVRAIVLRHRPEHLLHVVRSEMTDLRRRRDLRKIEAQMRETERRCDALISSSRDPIAYVHEGMHIRANEAYLEMFGFESFEDVEGMSLLDLVAPADVEQFKTVLKTLSKGELPPPNYALQARSMTGETFPATMEFATATYEGESCIQVVFNRREEFDPELAREVEELRQRDSATGLLNRPTFIRHLEDAVARAGRSEQQYGLLLIEPDHYSRILNDIGLDFADTLIATLADHLRAQIATTATIARFGDTSFTVLIEGDYSHTQHLAEHIRKAFAEHVFAIGKRSTAVSVSIGGVQIGEQIASVGQVLTRIFDTVRTVGELGGNAFSIFDPGATERAEEERVQRWIEQLRIALKNDEFILHYQPITNLLGEPLELYQVFLRLKTHDELISPTAFLEIAEERDLIAQIDSWVVKHAINRLAKQKRSGHTTHLLARIGPASFSDDQWLQSVMSELEKNGIHGSQLWLQTQESKVFTHLQAAQHCLNKLSSIGCRVGLEQFGSGLDSFQLLAHFKPAFVKLDRGLTADVATSSESLEKVRDIATRAKDEGIITFAEFVSDAASMSAFFNAGLDYVQGQFIAPIGPEMNYEF